MLLIKLPILLKNIVDINKYIKLSMLEPSDSVGTGYWLTRPGYWGTLNWRINEILIQRGSHFKNYYHDQEVSCEKIKP